MVGRELERARFLMTKVALPDYESPPVREVVCGVTFKKIEALKVPHIGLLWDEYRADYPECQDKPEIPLVWEEPDRTKQEAGLTILAEMPLPRSWFVSKDETQLIQVQRDRFLFNWKKMSESDQYVRFEAVFTQFQDLYAKFCSFLEKNNFDAPEAKQFELTYVNHMPVSEEWKNLGDIGSLFPDLSWQASETRFLPSPENLTCNLSFKLPDESGRLHVVIKRALRTSDQKEIILLDLTARGFIEDESSDNMEDWFNMAHEWIVRGFSDLTSDSVQKEHWGRK